MGDGRDSGSQTDREGVALCLMRRDSDTSERKTVMVVPRCGLVFGAVFLVLAPEFWFCSNVGQFAPSFSRQDHLEVHIIGLSYCFDLADTTGIEAEPFCRPGP